MSNRQHESGRKKDKTRHLQPSHTATGKAGIKGSELSSRVLSKTDKGQLSPDVILAHQQSHGNHFVQRLLAQTRKIPFDPKPSPINQRPIAAQVVQRYFLHTPANDEANPQHLIAQEKAPLSQSFLENESTPRNRPHTTNAQPSIPPLRVSENGNMAIEGTDLSARQAKVFFATQPLVDESNARLLEISSPYRLKIDQDNAVTINTTHNQNIINQHLGRVVPEDATTGRSGVNLDLRAGSNCNQVAEKVANVRLAKFAQVKKISPEAIITFPEFRLARYLKEREIDGKTHLEALARLDEPVNRNTINTISQDYATLVEPNVTFANKVKDELIGTHGVTPNAAIDLEYALQPYLNRRIAGDTHLQAAAQLPRNMDNTVTNNLAAAYTTVLLGYNPTARANQVSNRLQALGINQFAAPEVGQIFGSRSLGLPTDGRLTNYRTGERQNVSAEAWASHFAAVVAKSGNDTITLENYARKAEGDWGNTGQTKEYYFQMYGTNAGQSWHEAWRDSDRPTVNPLTWVIGEDKPVVWKRQLDGIPPILQNIGRGNYDRRLVHHKNQIDSAQDLNTAKTAYHAGLAELVRISLGALRAKANAIGKNINLTLTPQDLAVVNTVADGPTVITNIETWITALETKRDKKWKIDFLGRSKWQKHINALTELKTKIGTQVKYHNDRRV